MGGVSNGVLVSFGGGGGAPELANVVCSVCKTVLAASTALAAEVLLDPEAAPKLNKTSKTLA